MTQELTNQIMELIPTLPGWTIPERCVELASLVLEHKCNTVVEIGTFGGRAAFAMGLALKEQKFGRLYTLDPFKNEAATEHENEANRNYWATLDLNAIHKLMIENLWKLGLDEWVIPIRANSRNCSELFAGGIDFLGIDGNHSEPTSCADVQLYLPNVLNGGIVHMDDTDWPSTQKAVAMLSEQCDLIKEGENGHYRIYRKR